MEKEFKPGDRIRLSDKGVAASKLNKQKYGEVKSLEHPRAFLDEVLVTWESGDSVESVPRWALEQDNLYHLCELIWDRSLVKDKIDKTILESFSHLDYKTADSYFSDYPDAMISNIYLIYYARFRKKAGDKFFKKVEAIFKGITKRI